MMDFQIGEKTKYRCSGCKAVFEAYEKKEMAEHIPICKGDWDKKPKMVKFQGADIRVIK